MDVVITHWYRMRAISAVNIVTTHTLRCDSQPRVQEGLDATLRMFWELESLDIHTDDKSVLEDFNKEIVFRNGRIFTLEGATS